jgi:hypothetical protein
MRLFDAIGSAEALDREATVFVMKPWTPDSPCTLWKLAPPDYRIPQNILDRGFAYFLEVAVVLEVLEGFAEQRVMPTAEQRFELVLYYAENDAYPEWWTEEP